MLDAWGEQSEKSGVEVIQAPDRGQSNTQGKRRDRKKMWMVATSSLSVSLLRGGVNGTVAFVAYTHEYWVGEDQKRHFGGGGQEIPILSFGCMQTHTLPLSFCCRVLLKRIYCKPVDTRHFSTLQVSIAHRGAF